MEIQLSLAVFLYVFPAWYKVHTVLQGTAAAVPPSKDRNMNFI